MRRPLPLVAAALLSSLAVAAFSAEASAQSIIKNPGDHLNTVELEPHLILVPWNTPGNDLGWGLGFRATVPIVSNGFVSSINNSVGIGFGLDWMHYGCGNRRYFDATYDCGSYNHFMIPVVMQWNFFLARSWSVFGEPGLGLHYLSYSCPDYIDPKGVHYATNCSNSHTHLDFVLFGGARWHFSNYTALTFRIGLGGLSSGWDNGYLSVGLSFM
jgi:hypothetical protein